MSEREVVRVERDGAVALITLDRPNARNALNAELAGAFCAAVTACQDARAIVITGADPAFCAGLDLRNLGVERLVDLPPCARTVAASAVPTIAAVNGAAVTGGFEVALACDFIIASERAVFADTHLLVGVYPGPVLVDLPRRIGIAWAREMSLTGDFVDAQTALRIGIANHVVPHAELLAAALRRAHAIAKHEPDMVRAMRADWTVTVGLPYEQAHRMHVEHAVEGGFRAKLGTDIAAKRDAVLDRSRAQRREPG